MNDLTRQVKQLIIDTLNLEGMEPDDIQADAPLFGDGLGLDSIDALELGLALKNTYGITLKADDEQSRQHFHSVDTLVALIASRRQASA